MDVPIRTPMKSTARNVRVMSRWVSITESPFQQSLALIHGIKMIKKKATGRWDHNHE
jgi:hypothetical protein